VARDRRRLYSNNSARRKAQRGARHVLDDPRTNSIVFVDKANLPVHKGTHIRVMCLFTGRTVLRCVVRGNICFYFLIHLGLLGALYHTQAVSSTTEILCCRAFQFSSCSQGEALLARGERCRQPRDAGLPAPLSPCPAPRMGRESSRQEPEERKTEKPCTVLRGPDTKNSSIYLHKSDD